MNALRLAPRTFLEVWIASTIAFASLAPAQDSAPAATEAPGLRLAEPEWAQEVTRWSEPLIRDRVAVGFCVGAVQGLSTWSQGFGRVDAEREGRPGPNTVYEIGSISKTFTGVLLADGILRGAVQADDPVQRWAPEGCSLPQRKAPVQLLHLANHTSGWPRLPLPFAPSDANNPYADFDEGKLWAFLCAYQPKRRPGRLYAYSNLGAGALGHLVAKAQGETYGSLLRERITGPLGMGDTALALSPAMRERLASPYDVDGESGFLWDFDVLAGAGGIRSTVADMLIFARAAMSGREDLLGEAFRSSQTPTYEGRRGPVVGMGWHLHPERGLVSHNGQTGGYHSYLALHPKSQTAVVVLANTATGQIDRLGDNLLRTLLGEEPTEYDYRAAISLEEEAMRPLVGRYQLAPQAILEITLEGSKLYAQLTGQPRFRLHPESANRFFLRAVDAQISFERDEDGTCGALILHQGRDQRAQRLPAEEGEGGL